MGLVLLCLSFQHIAISATVLAPFHFNHAGSQFFDLLVVASEVQLLTGRSTGTTGDQYSD